MSEILVWSNQSQQNTMCDRIATVFQNKQCAVLPTESTYALACSDVDTATSLTPFCTPTTPFTRAAGGAEEARAWLPELTPAVQKLLRRCWPGSVSLLADHSELFPDSILQSSAPTAIRSPGHLAFLVALEKTTSPIYFVDLLDESGKPIGDASRAMERVGDLAAVVLDDGPGAMTQPSVIAMEGDPWHVVHEGAFSKYDLHMQLAHLILFVCTGNTCRSPMAEAFCRQQLAEHFQCELDAVAHQGFHVLSAGVSATGGSTASPESIEAARELGADLSAHLSRPMDEILAQQADTIVCMTGSHLGILSSAFPEVADRARLLNAEGVDLSDPYGQPIEMYRACAEQIQKDLKPLLEQLLAAQ